VPNENSSDQDKFWRGDFGDAYTARNSGKHLIAANSAMFSKILACTENVTSLIEFGANVGLNLHALRRLLPAAELAATDINAKAAQKLREWGQIKDVFEGSLLDFDAKSQWDFALSKGVLVHVNPDFLQRAYDSLYRASRRYICVVEYYNPSPVSIPYHGHQERLFKRDFAGDLLDRFPDLRLVDYGFVYHRDADFPQDDVTWFLLEKHS